MRKRDKTGRWTLADLIDFEILLAREAGSVDPAQRRHFRQAIRPQLSAIADAGQRRRTGLRLWLQQRRDEEPALQLPGRRVCQALNLAGWVAFALLAVSGMSLVAGLVLGGQQAVHVVIFMALTWLLPWLLFVAGVLLHVFGADRTVLAVTVRAAVQLCGRHNRRHKMSAAAMAALASAANSRRVLWAEVATLAQRGSIGFSLGLIIAFCVCLLLFDVRFYWETTAQTGMAAVLATCVQGIALPWSWLWPQAVPGLAEINASRLLAGALPVAGDGSWWRFLLLTLLVWGLLPRMLLLARFRYQVRRELAQLDLQTPRQRALWRRLSAVERGEVAAGPTDGVLVLDVGGHGVTGQAVRGFLLRRLRVNPLQTLPVAVLDDDDEARAHQALAAGPAGVVLLAEVRMLSPRQLTALHARLRATLGASVPLTWLVFALGDGTPAAVEPVAMQRWAQCIDSLRDAATEVVAYEP